MRCPTCKQESDRIIIAFPVNRETGRMRKVEGCENCFRPQVDAHVYTGKKIWHGYEAYGVKKTMQMNQDWAANLQVRAARRRRENATISEGAFNYLVDQSKKGLIRTPGR
jgi:hypothetical protein